jgi:hypothetical protein
VNFYVILYVLAHDQIIGILKEAEMWKLNLYARFQSLTAVKMSMFLFWIVALCGLVDRCQHVGEIYFLHFCVWIMETVCFSETLAPAYNSTQRHNPEQKTATSVGVMQEIVRNTLYVKLLLV